MQLAELIKGVRASELVSMGLNLPEVICTSAELGIWVPDEVLQFRVAGDAIADGA